MTADEKSTGTDASAKALAVLATLIECLDEPDRFISRLPEEIRKATGAECVAVIEWGPGGDAQDRPKIACFSPATLAGRLHSEANAGFFRSIPRNAPLALASGHEAFNLCAQAGFSSAIICPLALGTSPATIVAMGFPPSSVLEHELGWIRLFAERFGSLFARARAKERERNALAGSRRELEGATEALQLAREGTKELLAAEERSRRALLSALEDQQRTQMSLRESETRFRKVVETAPDAIFVQVNGVFAYVNSAALRLFGATRPEELLGHPVIDRFHPEFRDLVRERIRLLNEERREVESIDEVCLTLDGTLIYVNVSAVPFEFREEHGALVFARDITDRKRAQEVLRSTSETLEAVIQAAPIAIVTLTPEGIVQSWNPAAERMFGWSAAEACGKFLPTVSTEDLDAFAELRRRVLQGESVSDLELHRLRKDGTCLDVNLFTSPLRDSHGRVCGLLSMLVDITHRKAADAKLADQLRELQRWHEATLGREERILALKSQVNELLPRLGEPRRYDNASTLEPSKTETDWPSQSALMRLEASRRTLLSVIEDHKEAEAQVRRLNEGLEQRIQERTAELQAVNKELEAFSYSVSHDLRAPLRHISGYLELLRQEVDAHLNDQTRRFFNAIDQSAQRMGSLIEDLLAFSRAGRTEMLRTKIPMDEFVREAVRVAERDAGSRRIVWNIQPLPEVEADREMLALVLANLLANAVKYTRKRDPAVIEIGSKEEHGTYVFSIHDNGVGFDMRYADKLFGVFQRLHSTSEFEGTGVGLANVRRIIARHGGQTWAEGQVGQGATFYFALPRAVAIHDEHSGRDL